jgi:hypothetical protein
MRFFARLIFVAGMLYYVDATFYGGIYIQAGVAVGRHVTGALLTVLRG